ncbi:hypothetical protein, partial [Ferrimicrobium sp.]|uniref:hypothetical protein n=1 Tax=Ferrimicrobium sp. TaxID=2926050 RepID=UPI0026154503
HLGRSSDRNTTKLLSETRYEPLNRFALATEKHFPRSFTRPTLGGDLNSYLKSKMGSGWTSVPFNSLQLGGSIEPGPLRL